MTELIDLAPEFAEAWRGRDPFEAAFALEGEVFRKVKSRRTFRFELNGNGYCAKIHHAAYALCGVRCALGRARRV